MAKDKLSSITYGALKKLLEDSLVGLGVIKGKNCTVQSITDITGGKRVTFAWIDDEGEPHTAPMDVMNGDDGDDGLGIKSVTVNSSNHLIVTYDDDTTEDAGEIQGGGGGGGTTVVANPTLVGTEADLTGLQVGSTKYKVSTAKANPTLVGTETTLTALEINGVKYQFPTLPLAENQEV